MKHLLGSTSKGGERLSWILHIQMSPSYPNDMSLPEHNYGEVTMERELY